MARPRPPELVIIALLLLMALAAFTMDRSAGMDLCAPDSPDPFGRALWWYGENFDPLVSANPIHMQVISAISGFVFGPIEVAIAYGLWKRRPWVGRLAVVFSVAMLYSMVVHTILELWGEHPRPHPVVAVVTYAAYVVVPAWLLRHVWPASPRPVPDAERA